MVAIEGDLAADPQHRCRDVADGDQAPPEFAAMTMIPAKKAVLPALQKLAHEGNATIVVVRLSRMALRKKVTMPTTHMRVERLLVPDLAGDDLEAVVGVDHLDDGHGPIRKKTICAVPVSDSPSCSR